MIQSKDIYSVATAGSPADMTLASVNYWVKRYQSEGLSGLYTKPGQGRKPLISAVGLPDSDKDASTPSLFGAYFKELVN